MTEEHNEEMGKICSHCGEKKPLNEFRKRSGRRTGAHVRRGLCRSCRQRLSAERLAAARASAADGGRREDAEQAVVAEAQTMAAAARRSEPEAAAALQTARLASAEVAAAAESTKAGFVAELSLSGETDKKRKRRRRRKKTAAGAQPSGSELKLADDVAAPTAVPATSGPVAAESVEKPKRKRKKAKRKKSGQAKAAENLELLVGEELLADAGTDSDVADDFDAGMTAETQETGEANETAGEPAGKAKRKRKRSKRKSKRSGEDAAALSSEGDSGFADGSVVDSREVVRVSTLAVPLAGVDADPGVAEEQQEPVKKRKRKRKKKSTAATSPLTAEIASLPAAAEVEEKAPPTRKKTAKSKKAAKGQELPELKAAAVKEPAKPAAKVAATKPESGKGKAAAVQQAPAPAYKPIWPDKGAASANLLSLRSVLQDQDNVVRTVGQARVEDITELVEEPRKSAELIKREADAFHHTPLSNRRPAKHSNALTRREMQSMREAKLTDHRSRFINHAELVERSKRQQGEGKPAGADQTVKPVTGGPVTDGNANAEKDKQSKFEPFDYSVLRPTGKGVIRMRGRTDKGRRWYQEIEYDMAVTLVREQSAVVVNRQTINRLYSNRDFRSYILTRDNYTCYFCGEYGDTIAHLLPRAKGGHSTPLNCVCACNLCNQSKADKDLDVFLKHQKSGTKR